MSHGRIFASCLLLTLTPFARKKNMAVPSGTPGGSWSSSKSSWISSRTVARVERVEISTAPTAGPSSDRKISSIWASGCLLWAGDGGAAGAASPPAAVRASTARRSCSRVSPCDPLFCGTVTSAPLPRAAVNSGSASSSRPSLNATQAWCKFSPPMNAMAESRSGNLLWTGRYPTQRGFSTCCLATFHFR